MEKLKTLSPGECLLLLEESSLTMRDFIKLTLIDLVMKGVLQIQSRNSQSNPKDPIRKNAYLAPGILFHQHRALIHETLLVAPFLKNPEATIFLRTYVKIVVENAGDGYSYMRRTLRNNLVFSKYLNNSFWKRLLGRIELNEFGISQQLKLREELVVLGNLLSEQNDYSKRSDIASRITPLYGNIFLLYDVDPKFAALIDSALDHTLYQEKANSETGSNNFPVIDFHNFSRTFNSGYEAATRNSTSGYGSCGGGVGCSSCSGCSGCSGCGGCGGCGS